MKLALALVAPALLIAGTASAQTIPFTAHGESPDWRLSIDHGLIRYQDARGRVALRAPKPINGFAGEIYRARGMDINVVHGRCLINGTGPAYPMQATVRWRGRTMQGCAGSPVDRPPLGHGPGVAALDGSAWSIVAVDGTPAATARPATIRFHDGRVDGNAGCNSFGGAYQQRGPSLSTSQIISTQMACVGPGRNIEREVFHILEGPAQLTFRGADSLTISATAGSMTLSRTR